MSRRPAGGGAPAALAGLLMVTALALLTAAAARVPAVVGLLQRGEHPGSREAAAGPDWPALAAVEPANGPTEAGAAQGTEPPPAAATPAPAAAVGSDPASLAALEEMAAELGRYRAALGERERTIALREAVVTSVETRLTGEAARLEALAGELQRLTGQLSADERARIAQLVKVYEAMKAKNAALIFDPMPIDLLLPIVRGMRETKAAAIVAAMDPAKARALTTELARAREPSTTTP